MMSGIILVDASVATKWVLTEHQTPIALEYLHGERQLAAPSILKLEVSGAVIRRVRSKLLEVEPARLACDSWHAILDDELVKLIPIEEVYDMAIEFAFEAKHALADCLYLAAAKQLNATLLTSDEKFYERACEVYEKVELLAKAA